MISFSLNYELSCQYWGPQKINKEPEGPIVMKFAVKKNDLVDGCVIYCLGNMRSRCRDISEQNEGLELVVIQETGVGAI